MCEEFDGIGMFLFLSDLNQQSLSDMENSTQAVVVGGLPPLLPSLNSSNSLLLESIQPPPPPVLPVVSMGAEQELSREVVEVVDMSPATGPVSGGTKILICLSGPLVASAVRVSASGGE